jgi:hypothetical protein
MHYVATNKGWDIPGLSWSDDTISLDTFLRPLPALVLHPQAGSELG